MLIKNDREDPFEGKVRVRVSGILKENNKILLLKHENLGPKGFLWLPPGGGVEFGESLHEALKKEFLEETNLNIEVGEYLFTNEFLQNPYHAIEIFFLVKRLSGTLKLGFDPELSNSDQILSEVKFFSPAEINNLAADTTHNTFSATGIGQEITDLKGLFTFKH